MQNSFKTPVVLIPGLGASILEATWDIDFDWDYFYCKIIETDWVQIWPSIFSAIPFENICWANLMRVSSPDGIHFDSAEGVNIKAKDFGGLDGINILDQLNLYLLNVPLVNYFEETSNKLKELGYTQLYGAPYDFRIILDPNYLQDYVERFQGLIEKAYSESGNKKVNLISHSLGGPVTSYCLNTMSFSWRNKYIRKFIAISGPFGGATIALSACLTGVTVDLPISKEFMRSIEKNYAGVIWMINEPHTWDGIDIVNNYGTDDIPDILECAGEKVIGDLWKNRALDAWKRTLKYPNVETHLVHGTDVQTLFSLEYENLNFNNPIYNYKNKGDGTVPGISLESPSNVHGWDIKSTHSLSGATHAGILNDERWLNLIEKLLE